MEKEFSAKLKSLYGFDTKSNELYSVVLNNVFEELRNTTIYGVNFFDYYPEDELFHNLVESYSNQLESLLLMLISQSRKVSLTVHGVHLDQYWDRRQQMLSQVLELKNQCGC